MLRNTVTFGVALGALLLLSNAVWAGDNVPAKSGFSGGVIGASSTMTLGGTGTVAAATAAGDTELTWFHRYYRGYRAGYYNGFYAGVGGYPYAAPYYPYVAPYEVPYAVPYVGFYRPRLIPPIVGFYGQVGPFGIGVGINGSTVDVAAPVLSLNRTGGFNAAIPQATTPNPMPQPNPLQPDGSYRYDGGPANPIPLPKPDGTPNGQATPQTPATAGLPVSLPKSTPSKPSTPAKPYAYKGYGEK